MRKIKVETNLKDENGSGLILALMVLLVLSVLGASLGVVTIGSLQLSDANRDNNSAYYIAEAGANLAYEDFRKDVEESYADSTITSDTSFFDRIKGKVKSSESPYRTYGIDDTDDFEPQFGDTPTAIVSIDTPSSTGIEREYTINSVGEVNGKERTVAKKVSVTWKDKTPAGGSLNIPKETAVIFNSPEKVKNHGEILGYVYQETSNKITIKKNYLDKDEKWEENPVKEGKDRFKDIKFEQFIKYAENLGNQVNKGSKLESYKNLEGVYNKKELKGSIVIDVGSNNVVIFTEVLEMGKDKTIKVEGTGSLIIVVSDKVTTENDSKFNPDNNKVRIVYTGDKAIDISNHININGQIIAPFSKVEIGNHIKFYGTVVAKSYEVGNHSSLEYSEFTFGESDTGNGESESAGGDLITSEPAIESE